MSNTTSKKNFELIISIDDEGKYETGLIYKNEALKENDVYLALMNTFLALKKRDDILLQDIMTASLLVLSDNPNAMEELEKTIKGINLIKINNDLIC